MIINDLLINQSYEKESPLSIFNSTMTKETTTGTLGSTYWKELRDETLRWKKQNDEDDEPFFQSLSAHFLAFETLIEKYIEMLINFKSEEQDTNEKTPEQKNLILESRHALRYLMTLLSHQESQSSSSSHNRTKMIQLEAVYKCKLHRILSTLLSFHTCDLKCQSLAAKVLCNLGTSNRKTSLIILHEIQSSTWGEMIYATASTATGQREALAAVAASMHNFILALSNNNNEEKDNDATNDENDEILDNEGLLNKHFDLKIIATDDILICNLVRYILPRDTICLNKNKEVENEEERDMADGATLWISLLFEALCANGMFPQMYNILGFKNSMKSSKDVSRSDNENISLNISQNINNTLGISRGITPEQVVLLNCLGNSVETYAKDLVSATKNNSNNPLGGIAGKKGIETTIYFMTEIWLNLRQYSKHESETILDHQHEERYQGEISCMVHGAKVILDILGTALSCSDDKNVSDNVDLTSIRLQLGQNTTLLSNAILELGRIVDKLGIQNRGLKARELIVSNDDQHFMIGLVRLIGNLCYQSKANQDLVRETNVPFPKQEGIVNEQGILNTTATVVETTVVLEEKVKRNGLHVMLSCTTFAYGCFTLREWGIIAIRNILDNNDANQEEVAKLEAQEVINTPELKKLGVEINLDKKGKVHVVNNTK